MSNFEIFDAIVDGYEMRESEAIEYATGICDDWETSQVEKLPTYNRYLDTKNGIDIYYDFGADYYFYVVSDD